MTPLEVHIANLSPARRKRRRDAIDWLSLELIVLALACSFTLGVLLGMILRNAFRGAS